MGTQVNESILHVFGSHSLSSSCRLVTSSPRVKKARLVICHGKQPGRPEAPGSGLCHAALMTFLPALLAPQRVFNAQHDAVMAGSDTWRHLNGCGLGGRAEQCQASGTERNVQRPKV